MSNSQEYQFVNPYNFIPLGASKKTALTEEEKNLTGVIEYSVLTKTPLFIPNTSNDDVFGMNKKPKNEQDKSCAEDHKSYDFFTYEDLSRKSGPAKNAMPVIPGSEIRGMFRSNFEILTNSCLSAVDNDVTMSKRTNEVFQAGLLKRNENGTFDLYAAEDCLMRTKGANSLEDDWANDYIHYGKKCYIQNDLEEGTRVYFHRVPRKVETKFGGKRAITSLAQQVSDIQKDNLESKGYIIKGEPGPEMTDCQNRTMKQQKHCCHIFEPQNKVIKDNITVLTLEKVLQAYKDNGEHPYKEYADQWKKFKRGELGEYFPVYYSEALKGQFMLSPAAITREIYNRKIKDMMSDFQPCNDKNNLCPACSLFGTVVQKGKGSFGVTSRIRFSDLTCDEESAEKCYMPKTTLAPLSSPKLNNMEFYLRRPASDAVFWTYDYYIDKKGTLHPNKCGINGRKFYWHNMSPDLKGCAPSNQNITVRPVKAGILFHGKLYFQRLSATELNQLIYLLNAGEDDNTKIGDRTHGYKLGGAKPLGLGSIAVSVRQVMLRDVVKDSYKRYVERTEHPYEGYKPPKFDDTIVDEFAKMTNFNSVDGEKVSYPVTGEEGDEGYTWYVQNHVTTNKGYLTGGMPNKREMMGYAEYMQAMEPKTQRVEFREFQLNQVYRAKVVKCNKKNVSIKVEGVNGEIYYKNISGAQEGELNKRFRKNEEIRVNYIGSSEHEGKVSYNFKPVQ